MVIPEIPLSIKNIEDFETNRPGMRLQAMRAFLHPVGQTFELCSTGGIGKGCIFSHRFNEKMESEANSSNRTLAFSMTFYLILVGHFLVDSYSALIPATLTRLEIQFDLTPTSSAWLLACGSFSSGFSQPIFGWLGKRLGTVAFIGLGILMAAVFIPTISMIAGDNRLYLHYILGMIGVGIFHPIGASSIGAINPKKRSVAISSFFVAGMAGHITGSLVGPWMIQVTHIRDVEWLGFTFPPFAWLMIPGILLFIPAYLASRLIHRRQKEVAPIERFVGQEVSPSSIHQADQESKLLKDETHEGIAHHPIFNLFFLYVASATRFFVNLALVFLMVRLAASQFAEGLESGWLTELEASNKASRLTGFLQASMISGMAVGGLAAGFLIPQGRERGPLIWVPIGFAPLIVLIPHCPPTTVAPILFFFTGIGFASMVPVSVSLAQRLLPNNTSFASGLMLGGAWAIAMLGPPFAEFILTHFGMAWAYVAVAILLVLAGCMMFPARQIHRF